MYFRNKNLLSIVAASVILGGSSALIAELPTSMVNIASNSINPIDLNNSSVHITASGSIDVNGSHFAIKDKNFTDSNTINNEGSVSVVNSHDTTAILLLNNGSVNSGSITNSGTISATINGNDDVNGLSLYSNGDGNISSNITNSGTISATINGGGYANGLNLYSYYGNISGDITNSGTISATINGEGDASGLNLYSYYGNISGDVTNSGTISAVTKDDSRAIGININAEEENISGDVTNSGTISAIAKNDSRAIGIYINADENISGNIVNNGVISTEVDGNESFASGIIVEGDVLTGDITNSGTITSTSNGNKTGANGIYVRRSKGKVTNSGIINVKKSGNQSGYYYYGFLGIGALSVRLNEGTISNSGTLNVESDSNNTFSVGLSSWHNSGNITNSGVITANSKNNGLALSTWIEENDGNITNSGVITANSKNNGLALSMWIGENDGNITNSGTIISNSNGHNSLSYGSVAFAVERNRGNILNSGTITANETDTNATTTALWVTKNDANITNSGTITANGVDNNRTFAVQIKDSIPISKFNNTKSGVINGSVHIVGDGYTYNDGVINLGLTPSDISNFSQSKDGVLGIKIADATHHSKLKVGYANFEDGTTIDVNTKITKDNLDMVNSDQNITDIVYLDGGSTYNIDANATKINVKDSSALLGYTLTDRGNQGKHLDLTMKKVMTIKEATDASTLKNADSAAGALDTILADGTHDEMKPIIASMFNQPTIQDVAKAVVATTPQAGAFVGSAMGSIVGSNSSVVNARMSSANGLNSGGVFTPAVSVPAVVKKGSNYNIWAKTYIGRATQDNADGLVGYKLNTKGIGVGIDGKISDNALLGAGLFYTDADLKLKSVNQRANIDTYSFVLYGNKKLNLMNKDTILSMQLGYSKAKVKTKRVDSLNDTYKGKFDANVISANARLTQNYDISNKLDADVSLFAQYVHYKSDAYREKGPNPALENVVASSSSNKFVLGVGSIFNYHIDGNSKINFGGDIGYKFGKKSSVTTHWGATPALNYTTYGHKNGHFVYNAGVGYSYKKSNYSVDVNYNFEGEGSHYHNHTFSAKFKYKF